MALLHIVRHAQPDFAGDYDSITELGARQSTWLGSYFAERGVDFARVIGGRLKRHAQTIERVVAEMPGAPSATFDPRLNEYDLESLLGVFAADSVAELKARGDRQGYFTVVRDVLRSWSTHDGDLGGAESWPAFGQRARGAIADAADGLTADAHVLIVTSGGIIGRIVADLLGAGPEAAIQLNLQTRNTGLTEVVVGRSAQRLIAFNSVPHLQTRERQHAITHV